MKPRLVFILVLALTLVLMGTRVALAAGGYDLSWWTVAGGGGVSTSLSPGYSLAGTTGQATAGGLSGNGYTLSGGFWVSETSTPSGGNIIYLPLIMR